MHVAVRPPLATAVAIVGAGAIALSPVQPSLPDLGGIRASDAAVALVAQPNPLVLWSEVIARAVENAGGLGQEVLSDPVPVLRQLLKNQFGYLGTAAETGKGIIEGLAEYFSPDNPFGLQAGIREAITQIKAGEIAAGFSTLTSTIIAGPLVVGVGLPLLTSGLLQVPITMAQNAAAVVGALFDTTTIVPLLTAAIGPIIAPINAFGESVQDIVEAVAAGHLIDALTAVINVPARLVDAVLNGYTDVNGGITPGLLTVGDNPFSSGLLQSVFVNLPRAIAAALGAEATPAPSARVLAADVTANPVSSAAATVTLTVPSAQSNSQPAGSEATSASVPEAAEPSDGVKEALDDDAAVHDVGDETAEVTDNEGAAVADDEGTAAADDEEAAAADAEDAVADDTDSDGSDSESGGSDTSGGAGHTASATETADSDGGGSSASDGADSE